MNNHVNVLTRGACALLVSIAAASTAWAGEDGDESAWKTEGYVTVGTDYVWRGVSQTDGHPGIQGEFGLYHDSGFYGQIWAGRMDFGVPGDGIHSEFDFVLGWQTDLGESASLDISLLRAIYPGANPGYNINYSELGVTLGFADHYEFTVAYSNDLFRLGHSAVYYALAADWPIGDTPWGVKAEAGLYDLDRIAGDRYTHAYLGAYYKLDDRFTLDAGYYKTFGYGDVFEDSIGSLEQADSRAVATLTWSF